MSFPMRYLDKVATLLFRINMLGASVQVYPYFEIMH